MLIDSHCHLNILDLKPFGNDLSLVIDAATRVGIEKMLCIATNQKDLPDVLACADRFQQVYATVGMHPCDSQDNQISKEELISLANKPKVVGIGETGLDYYYEESHRDIQKDSFRKHIQAAIALNLPVIIHSRSAPEDTLQILKEEGIEKCGAVLHCFTESWDMAKAALDMGIYISISGIVTFKNAHQVKDVASKVPMDRLLVETDSPFLAPMPYRGKPNYPAYVKDVAVYIAAMRGLSFEVFAKATTDNFYQLFKKVPR
jgi:TatD DNase family protein